MAENLILPISFSPSQFASSTAPQFNNPNAFTSGNRFDVQNAVKSFASVGLIGLTAKRVFDSFTGGVGQRTGRNDLQSKINRGKKTVGIITQIGGGFAVSPVLGFIAIGKIGIDEGIDFVEREIQRVIDIKEASYRQGLRENRINESRYR